MPIQTPYSLAVAFDGPSVGQLRRVAHLSPVGATALLARFDLYAESLAKRGRQKARLNPGLPRQCG